MICQNCGASHKTTDPVCPYCGTINEASLPSNTSGAGTINKSFRLLTIGICGVLSLIVIVFAALTFYFHNYEEFYRQRQVSGSNRTSNLAKINTYLEEGQYLRALSLAEATDTNAYSFEHYPEVYEELHMIDCYASFMYDIQDYIVNPDHFEHMNFSKYCFDRVKEVFDTIPTSERSKKIKEELTASLRLYLKYYYQLTDEEIQTLEDISHIYDYKLEGVTDFEDILKGRVKAYERAYTAS